MTEPGRSHDARDTTEWERLAMVSPVALVDARLQLHHAAQIIVSAPISYLEPQPDDSHTNLEWLPGFRALATRPLPSPDGLRFALHPADLSLRAISGGVERASLKLRGRSSAEGVAWLAAELRRAGFDDGRLTTRKHYEIRSHPVADGAAFGALAGALDELAHAYHDAWILTSEIAARESGASPPRGWPHHFDLATLITLAPTRDGVSRSIGVGLSPGDDSYTEPYLYVGPYPHPPVTSLPTLTRGHWHTVGWVGAVHTMTDLTGLRDAQAQAEDARVFVNEAVAACRALLGAR